MFDTDTQTSLTPNGALPEGRYAVWVRATNQHGLSEWSDRLEFETGRSQPPASTMAEVTGGVLTVRRANNGTVGGSLVIGSTAGRVYVGTSVNRNDLIYGGNDHDSLYGGADQDAIHAGSGNDTVGGTDTNHKDQVLDRLFGDEGDDGIVGFSSLDVHSGIEHL